ncbi:MAG TPA: restriction endonuclease [bacterium]|nr:restriction endonuclease [bacterium]
MNTVIVLVSLFALLVFVAWIIDNAKTAKVYRTLRPKLDNLENQEQAFKNQQADWARKLENHEQAFKNQQADWARTLEAEKFEWARKIEADKKAIEMIAHEKSVGFPWLAEAYADYFHLLDMKESNYLRHKSHPAVKSAQQVREIAQQRRIAEKTWRVLKYQLKYYEELFPFLVEFKEEAIDDLIRQLTTGTPQPEADDEDPVRHWLTQAEYSSLASATRNQLALDRYWRRKKSSWELGRDYERYIGYLYEVDGCRVFYQGIIEGFADLGRDLVVEHPSGQIEIIQCKYWSQDKLIHEKHIFQLYGTLVAYRIDHPQSQVSATFVTSTALSDRANQFTKALNIRSLQHQPLKQYPCIKCNVSQRDGEKIYHLPFDQQYDRTLIGHHKLECYLTTVAEAERLGFRRAFRWHGDSAAL